MRINRRAITLITTAAIAIGVPLAAAPAAHAATRQVFICHDSTVSANIGDTLIFHNDCANDTFVNLPYPNPGIVYDFYNAAQISPNDSWTVSAVGLGSTTVSIREIGTGAFHNISVNVVTAPVPVPVLQGHDYLQQVGVPASGSCANVPSPTGHWPGFPFGGWTKSWAQWINNGKGGAVCTREIRFDPILADYVLVS